MNTVKKIECNSENVAKYVMQNSVIRNTKQKSNLNYGKICIMTDSDVDG